MMSANLDYADGEGTTDRYPSTGFEPEEVGPGCSLVSRLST
jgi:hypothetical protein